MRAHDDPAFLKFLLALANGALQTEETTRIAVPSSLRLQCGASPAYLDDLLRQIYPTVSSTCADPAMFTERPILTPRNKDVDLINALLIEKFCGDECSYKIYDTIIDDDCKMYLTEFLNTLCPGGMSPYNLVLKVYCLVILLRNLDPSSGLCNGTRLICKKFLPNLIQCEISTGFSKGEFVLLPHIIRRAPDSTGYPFQFQRVQFLIKLCFVMTINKSQGQTLQEVGVYIRQPCFSHGQLYVGLSRARKASIMWLLDETSQENGNESLCTTNVVSYQLLEKEGII